MITAKYADHLPVNRQVEIFARHGVTLARQTLGDWVARATDVLTSISQGQRAHEQGSSTPTTPWCRCSSPALECAFRSTVNT